MRQLLILSVFSLFITSASGQFKVEIGNDTTYCYQNFKNGIELSPHLKIENGTPPYTYIWETYWEAEVPFIKKNVFTASDFLNDTTLSNPIFKTDVKYLIKPMEWIQFTLIVTDKNGLSVRDSIRIRTSDISDTYIIDGTITEVKINQGDSIWLDGANDYMGIKPYQKYIWEPITGMSNPDSAQTWCKPVKEEGYKFSVIDSVGCQSAFIPLYQIRFKPTEMKAEIGTNDTILCGAAIERGDSVFLAPHLKIENGVPPYTYVWSGFVPFEFNGNTIFRTPLSYFINDTTTANPTFKHVWALHDTAYVKINLAVTDSLGNTATDSMYAQISLFNVQQTIENYIYINKGDSLFFDVDYYSGGKAPYRKYAWEPIDGLNYPDSSRTWCKPLKDNIRYGYRITDSINCTSNFIYEATVFFNSPSSAPTIEANQQVYQQGRVIYWINESGLPTRLSFYDLSGKLLYSEIVTGNQYEPNDLFPSSGIYPCVIENKNGKSQLKYQWFPD